MGSAWARYTKPEVTPYNEEITFDPLYGFPNGRKERVMIATEAEMISAKLPREERDYCAHTKIDYLRCIADVWPLAYKCSHEKHAQALCQYDDYILRMKEYERERRLMVRKERIAKKKAAEALAA
ncbi:NADH dehydrogenase [ubiquinone] 1 beta subcomplex subunit 7 isoform X2 [Contarinia nasturtii]|uniref:NADH dehydrogenase [ubiquinone] 1 beta subcomplex subunit 7 isoform X2 n=1 Tax=Contarinia nasturtii TaxID=265458 RepID=UPI0012D4B431|nr:NADH dehydrogenase [ubiquinone] 1 beta subcomplex subunit 7 isoform X2 [Contarinia nasturtii]